MLILGIETATPQVSCAIGGHEGVLASSHFARERHHAEILAPSIKFTVEQAGIELREISVVAVDLGPGLFTGLRVGIASAKALAYALKVPMIGVSSLDMNAFPVRHTARLIVSTVDARRGEIFYAFYRRVPGGVQRVSDEAVASAEDVASRLTASGEDCLVVGDGGVRYADVFEDEQHVEVVERGFQYPSAASVVLLAHAHAMREQWVNPWEIEPHYLREPDARINFRSRERS